MASAQSRDTPLPSARHFATSYRASAWFWSAARRCKRTASAQSCGTPSPRAKQAPRLYCTARARGSGRRRGGTSARPPPNPAARLRRPQSRCLGCTAPARGSGRPRGRTGARPQLYPADPPCSTSRDLRVGQVLVGRKADGRKSLLRALGTRMEDDRDREHGARARAPSRGGARARAARRACSISRNA